MNTGETNRVTSLTFTHYDPAEYLLPLSSNLSLNSINKTILGLFGNDIYIYTMLVGKAKGLWWRYWFMDNTTKGYQEGDLVFANGIEEMQFLKNYWGGVKAMSDYSAVVDLLPQFVVNDETTVARYLTALAENFSLGNRAYERQMYISLKDDNKDKTTIEDSWKPYLVTAEELNKRESLLVEMLESIFLQHNETYHKVLDKLDADDRAYEKQDAASSIYDELLTKYLPLEKVSAMESQTWVDLVNTPYGNSILGFGNVDYDFLHIYKPLGSSLYHLETWIRNDGHVTVRGYVPVGLMTEVVPDAGSQDYSRRKMGGQRRYAFRFDYPINDIFSKVFFRNKAEEIEEDATIRDLTNGPQEYIYKRDDSKDIDYQKQWDSVQSDIDTMQADLDTLQSDMAKFTKESTQEQPKFPANTDQWARGESMIYPEGVIVPALTESKYLQTMSRPFLINPEVISGKSDGKQWLIDPKYKKDSSVVGLINPKELLSHIKDRTPDSTKEWAHWKLSMDSTLNSPEVTQTGSGFSTKVKIKNVYSRHVVFSFKDISNELLENLLFHGNANVRAMLSSKDGKLDDFLKQDKDNKFRVVRYELKQVEEELTQSFTDSETGKVSTGLLHVTYEIISQIECAIDLKEDKADHLRMDDVVDHLGDFADELIRDGMEERQNRIYQLINYRKNSSAGLLYYPSNNKNTPLEKIMETQAALIKKNGHWEIFDDLLNSGNYDHMSQTTAVGDNSLENHTFIRKFEQPAQQNDEPSPVDLVNDNDPSYIASNMRLIREFGTIYSPPIFNITSSTVLPDAAQLIAPSVNCCPGVTLSDWTWANGQSIIFNVPNDTQNISFEITGMLNSDNSDFSFYYLPLNSYDCFDCGHSWETQGSTTEPSACPKCGGLRFYRRLKWLSKAFDYKKALVKLALAEQDGLSDEGAILHMNAQHMLGGISKSIIDNLSFASLMRARVVDWSKCDADMQVVIDESKCLTGYDDLDELFNVLWEHIDCYLRLGYLYYVYETLLQGMMDADNDQKLMLAYLRSYLLKNDMVDASATQQMLARVNTSISEKINSGSLPLADAMSKLVTEINKYHEKHLRQSEAVHGGIPHVPLSEADEEYDGEYEEYEESRKKWHNSLDENVTEIDVYCDEVIGTCNAITSTKKMLKDYLQMDLEASLDKKVRESLDKLKIYGRKYCNVNASVCWGYVSYINKWCDILFYGAPNTKAKLISIAIPALTSTWEELK